MTDTKETPIRDIAIFNTDALDVITHTPLFNESEKNQLVEVSENMENAFQYSQVFRTDTEVRISVLNDIKFPTQASKYYQALREMNVHQTELVHLLFDYEVKKQEMLIHKAAIMKYQKQLEDETEEYKRIRYEALIKQKEIELEKTAFMLKNMKRTADGRKQEVLQWDRILKELKPSLEEANIPLNNPDSHQKISYLVRHIKQTIHGIQSGSQMSGSEANNLFGQLITNAKVVQKEGLVDSVLGELNLGEKVFVDSQKILPVQFSDQEKQLIEAAKQRELAAKLGQNQQPPQPQMAAPKQAVSEDQNQFMEKEMADIQKRLEKLGAMKAGQSGSSNH